MKTLVIGATSFLGKYFYKNYKKLSPDIQGTCNQNTNEYIYFNLLNPYLDISLKKYTYALITAGITKVSFCEQEKTLSHKINIDGTISLIKKLKKNNVIPIFFSSDYVFDGIKGLYTETDPLNPLNEYGCQKAVLEQEIPKICGKDFLIFRLGKVFSLKKDKSLLDEMAFNLSKNKPIYAAYDNIITPIYIQDVIQSVVSIQRKKEKGIFNLCGKEIISRYDLAKKIAEKMNKPSLVQKISLDDLTKDVLRPKNTTMLCNKLQKTINLKYTSIANCIEQIVKNYE